MGVTPRPSLAPPLCIIQARLASTRLPGKMLLTLGGEMLIERAWRIASEAFGAEHCVIAMPQADARGPLADELTRIKATWDATWVNEDDVLGRFHHVAHRFRWHPESVIVRYTPDDPFKTVAALRRVAAGERLPVEVGGEAFTLGMLDQAHRTVPEMGRREHLTHALFPTDPPAAPMDGRVWTIDNREEYEAAVVQVQGPKAKGKARSRLPNTGRTGDLSDRQMGELQR